MAAARTASATYRESLGSLTLFVFTFADVVTGDTFASGLSGKYFTHWTTVTTAPGTQTNCGSMASYSAGTFTMVPDEDTQDLTLFVLCKN